MIFTPEMAKSTCCISFCVGSGSYGKCLNWPDISYNHADDVKVKCDNGDPMRIVPSTRAEYDELEKEERDQASL